MLKVTNPATETVLRELAEDTAATMAAKAGAARAAQPAWAARPLAERKAIIMKFRELLVRDEDRLARLLTSEVGKPLTQARNEVKGTLPRIDYFLEHVEATLRDEAVFDDATQKMRERITHEPLGVVANISAWNYPYFVGSNVFIPALLTGNAVLYKPSEFAALTGLAITELLHEAGVPKDVFAPIVGGGAVGAILLDQPINGVFFTGSYVTGRRVAEAAARRLVRAQLELGGKDPAYVTDDVDVARAAESTADGAFYNNGQSCCSVERVYVHTKVYDAFIERFVATVRGFKVGDPLDEKTYIGPLTRPMQVNLLEEQVKDAVAKGARVLTGGKRLAGAYFEPTVLADVTHEMTVMREESFGPIIGIQRVANDAEALKLMNDTNYGLTAAVYARDAKRAEAVLTKVHAGSAYWNCCDRVSPRLPWTGRGHSGLGSTLSKVGILAFVQPKAWHLRG